MSAIGNAAAWVVDYTCATDAVLRHTHIMRDDFARRGLVEVEQTDPHRISRMGIYLLTEQKNDERLRDMVRRISEAAKPVLPELE